MRQANGVFFNGSLTATEEFCSLIGWSQVQRVMSARREDSYVLIDFSPCLIQAGMGVYEVFRRPLFEFPACAALRLPLPATVTWEHYLVGQALTDAQRAGEQLHIVWPLSTQDSGQITRNTVAHVEGIQDWLAVEALLRHILFVALGLPARPVSHHILIAIPSGVPLRTHELFMQLLFEHLHLSAVMLVDRSIAQTYAYGNQSGLVVDVLESTTEVSVVVDNVVEQPAKLRSYIGERDLDLYLAHLLLQANPQLPSLLRPDAPLQGAALRDGLLHVIYWLKTNQCISFKSELLQLNTQDDAPPEATTAAPAQAPPENEEQSEERILEKAAEELAARKANARPAVQRDAQVLNVPHPFSSALPAIPVGPERHRYAEPLFEPSLLATIPSFIDPRAPLYDALQLEKKTASVIDTALQALKVLDLARRAIPGQYLVVTGKISTLPGIPKAVDAALARTTLGRTAKLVKQPDYFSEFKERPDLASFLGSTILAKLGFTDPKYFYSKVDYSEMGPSMVSTIPSHDN